MWWLGLGAYLYGGLRTARIMYRHFVRENDGHLEQPGTSVYDRRKGAYVRRSTNNLARVYFASILWPVFWPEVGVVKFVEWYVKRPSRAEQLAEAKERLQARIAESDRRITEENRRLAASIRALDDLPSVGQVMEWEKIVRTTKLPDAWWDVQWSTTKLPSTVTGAPPFNTDKFLEYAKEIQAQFDASMKRPPMILGEKKKKKKED